MSGLEGETGTSASNLNIYYDHDDQNNEEDLQIRKQNLSMMLKNAYAIKEEIEEEEDMDFEGFNDDGENQPLFGSKEISEKP